uniref:Zona pellucida sperm-binding protein 4 n=1 Tax=Zonotrichia albicollis TaxID=44394 RepID=A0A8D2N3U1_ZONAL
MGVVGWSWAASGVMLFWVFLGPLALALGAPISVFSDPTLLTCGQKSLQACSGSNLQCGTLKPLLLCPLSLDTEGKAHALQNDSGCGLLVSGTPEGSRKISVSYAGCYVFEWVSGLRDSPGTVTTAALDHNYLILVGLEGIDAAGQKVLHEETLLRCPVDLPAVDAPSSSVCLAVPSQDQLPCASLPISQGDCEARGCCYDPRDRVKPCYFGNTVTAHCTPDGQFSIAVSQDVTLPPVALDSVQLASGHSTGCVPVLTNNAFVVYQFPLSASGTTFQVRTAAVARLEELEQPAIRDVKTGSLGSVTRDSIFRYYPGADDAYSCFLLLLNGPWVSSVPDGSYTSYYIDSDYPVVKTLRDPVYAEVKILQRTDPDLILVLHHCWATPSTNPQQQQQWPVLVDGCPYAGDNYQTQLMPPSFTSGLLLPSHYQCFTLYTFTFVDSTSHEKLSGLVRSCGSTSSYLQPSYCSIGGKRSAEPPFQEGPSHVSSKGPVIFLQHELRQDAAKDGIGKCGSRAGEGAWSKAFLQKG